MKCIDCVHWNADRLNKARNAAPCAVLRVGNGSSMNLIPHPKGAGVYSEATFGCVLFEQKPLKKEPVPNEPNKEFEAFAAKVTKKVPKKKQKRSRSQKKSATLLGGDSG